MITKYLINVFITCCVIFMLGCSDNNSPSAPGGRENAEVPETADKEFKFYKDDNLNWSFKVLPASDPTSSVFLINSSTAQVNGTGSFYYKKISKTQATVSCFFMTRIAVGGNVYGQWNQYEITLTFLSGCHGKFEGTQLSNPHDKGKPISGMFVYNSDKELEEILDEAKGSDVSNVDWTNLTKFAWLNEVSDNIRSKYIFDENGKVIFEFYDSKLTRLSGTYKTDKKNNILQINIGDMTEFKVMGLNDSELLIRNVEFDNTEPCVVYKAVSKEEKPNGDIKISAPELNILPSSVQVKGTILSDMALASKGVLLGLEPNVVYENCIDCNSSNSDVVNITLNTASGYKYYVRLYAKTKNGEYYYGEEKEFTAQGTKVTQIKGEQIYWNPRSVKFKLDIPPYIIKDYGICWGTEPNPKVTDYYLAEKSYDGQLIRQDIWELSELKKNTKYYVRAYHIEGSQIIYYPGEIQIQTLGLDAKINLDLQFNPANFKTGTQNFYFGELWGVNFVVNWAGLPLGSYKTYVYFFNQNTKTGYGGLRQEFFMEGPNGSKSLFADKLVFYGPVSTLKSVGSYVNVTIYNLDDTPIANAYFKCAWNYTKFVFNPEPQPNIWTSVSTDSEAALQACMVND